MTRHRPRAEVIGVLVGDEDEVDVVERRPGPFKPRPQLGRDPWIPADALVEQRIDEDLLPAALQEKALVGDVGDGHLRGERCGDHDQRQRDESGGESVHGTW